MNIVDEKFGKLEIAKAPDQDFMQHVQKSMEQQLMDQAEEVSLSGTPQHTHGPRQSILDREIYIPYQSAIDSILDDTFDQQPLIVQMLQGWFAEVFRRYAQKRKGYQDIVVTCAKKVALKDAGRSFGPIMPLAQRPQPNHIFLSLVKLKQLKKPMTVGDFDYYRVSDMPISIKNTFIYPSIEESVPGLLTYLKANRIQLLLGNDFAFALPVSILEHPDFAPSWQSMETKQGMAMDTLYISSALHAFKFI